MPFLKKREYRFFLESNAIENTTFLWQKLILRQIEWGVQNGRLTKNGVCP